MTDFTSRIIRSTWQKADIEDPEYAEQIIEAIDAEAHGAVRKSTAGTGSDSELAYVVQFTDPATGDVLWAYHYSDATGTEYIDYPIRATAEAYYEEQVRGLQGCLDGVPDPVTGGPQYWWDVTDVDGVSVKSEIDA
jgi:hypothetical protein